MTPDRVISAPWLSLPATQAVFAALEGGGYTARAVGGIVRNTLLGLPATDIDIATDAVPAETMRLAKAAGLKTVATGIAHGTVTLIARGIPFEVTTLRRDVATDGRHALVAFTGDWAADAARRDFTINALYCSRDGQIFDPLGGMADLDPVKIRFIGSAGERICEDYLRILRFFRFSATYCADGVIDRDGLTACIAHRAGLARISGERIRTELMKLLAARHSLEVTTVLASSGVFSAMFDQVALLDGLSRMVAIDGVVKHPPDPLLRFAALAVQTAVDVAAFDMRLKFSARDRNRLMAVVDNHGRIDAAMTVEEAQRAAYQMGMAGYLDAVLLNWVRGTRTVDDAAYVQLAALPQRWTMPVFPLSGADVRALGIAPGPLIGAVLRAVEKDWVAGGFAENRTALLEVVRARVGASD
ncbi:MAG: CCA tRNA nucleotidyltransferase [Hyphomicrobiaceae bacterium]